MNNKRPESMQRITTPELAQAFIEEQLTALRALQILPWNKISRRMLTAISSELPLKSSF